MEVRREPPRKKRRIPVLVPGVIVFMLVLLILLAIPLFLFFGLERLQDTGLGQSRTII